MLRIQHDSCYGEPGAWAVEMFENIGQPGICEGLCSMNSQMCVRHVYIGETRNCFLQVLCQIQLVGSGFIPLAGKSRGRSDLSPSLSYRLLP